MWLWKVVGKSVRAFACTKGGESKHAGASVQPRPFVRSVRVSLLRCNSSISTHTAGFGLPTKRQGSVLFASIFCYCTVRGQSYVVRMRDKRDKG